MKHCTVILTLILISGLMCFSSCAKRVYYDIDTETDIQSGGNYVIRWQVNPGMDGNVEIYASTDANRYPVNPVVVESIGKEVATYQSTGNEYAQQYFLMVFGGREMRVVGNRVVATQGVTNLRDFGGYMTTDGGQVKWGQLYRSGAFRGITPRDSAVIESIGIADQMLLVDTLGAEHYQLSFAASDGLALLPDVDTSPHELRERIYRDSIPPQSVPLMYRQLFEQYAYHNPQQFGTALHFLLDPSHYPIMISDEWGKDRTAFLVMLIQSVLNVSRADILNDYLLSNQLLHVEQLEPNGFAYPATVQESITEFYRCRPNDLHAIMFDIERRYGSISQYMSEVLHFTPKDQQDLRALLLY